MKTQLTTGDLNPDFFAEDIGVLTVLPLPPKRNYNSVNILQKASSVRNQGQL